MEFHINFLYLSVLYENFILHLQVMLVCPKVNQLESVLTVQIGYLCQQQKRRGTYQYFTMTNKVYFAYNLSYSLPCHFKSSKINLNMSFSKPFSWKVCSFLFLSGDENKIWKSKYKCTFDKCGLIFQSRNQLNVKIDFIFFSPH